MTRAETVAYAAGIRDVVRLARASADKLEATTRRPLAVGFGVEALRSLADAAEAMARSPENRDVSGAAR